MQKNDSKGLPKEVLYEKRKQVIHLHDANTPVMQIVKITNLSWPAVNTAIRLFKEGGLEALSLSKRGRKNGTGRILNPAQEDDIRNILYNNRPWQVGLRHQKRDVRIHLWNRAAVKRLIHQKCGVNLSERGVGKYLQRWGFPLMKKNQRPIKRCKKNIQNWLTENYEDLKQRTETENAAIYWVSRRRIIIEGDPKWPKRLSMISAIDSHGIEHWIIVKGYFTEVWHISFFKALTSDAKKNVIAIRDNYNLYKGRDFWCWPREQKGEVEIFPPSLL